MAFHFSGCPPPAVRRPAALVSAGRPAPSHRTAGRELRAGPQGLTNKTAIASVLREFGTGQRALSHAALDELPASKPVEHLRAILVATGTLPRDEHLARLERWIARTLAERGDPGQRQLLYRYAVWHLLRRLRQRTNNTAMASPQAVNPPCGSQPAR
jgi:hypothetical protein